MNKFEILFVVFSVLFAFGLSLPLLLKAISPLHNNKLIWSTTIVVIITQILTVIFLILAVIFGFFFTTRYGILIFIGYLAAFCIKEFLIPPVFARKYNKNHSFFTSFKQKEFNVFYPYFPVDQAEFNKFNDVINANALTLTYYWHLTATKDNKIFASHRALTANEVNLVENNNLDAVIALAKDSGSNVTNKNNDQGPVNEKTADVSNNKFESMIKYATTDFLTQLKSMPLAKFALVINNNEVKGNALVNELLDASKFDLDFFNNMVIGAINSGVYNHLLAAQKTVKHLILMAPKKESCAFFLNSLFLSSSFNANFRSNLYLFPTKYSCKNRNFNVVREFLCTNAINNRAIVVYYSDKDSLDINLLKKVVSCTAAGFVIHDINEFVQMVIELRAHAADKKLKHKHSSITM